MAENDEPKASEHRPGDPRPELRRMQGAESDDERVSWSFRPDMEGIPNEGRQGGDFVSTRRRRWLGPASAVSAAALFALFLLKVAADVGARLWEVHPALGGLALAVTALAFCSLALVAGYSIADYLRVERRMSGEPAEVALLNDEERADVEELRRLKHALTKNLYQLGVGLSNEVRDQLLAKLRDMPKWPRDQTREWLIKFDREVLGIIDKEVRKRALGEAVTIGVLAAASPRGVLDAAIVLTRQAKLVRDIALAYGFRPGRVGTMRLLRESLVSASVAAGIDGLTNELLTVSVGKLARIAGIATEGLVSGMFTLRVARSAVRACRPIRNPEAEAFARVSVLKEFWKERKGKANTGGAGSRVPDESGGAQLIEATESRTD